MPLLTITLKGDQLRKHTVTLHHPLNLRYLKLLHVNHNVTSVDLKVKTVGAAVDLHREGKGRR